MGAATDRAPAEENVPGAARQLPPDRTGHAEVDRPGVEPGFVTEDRLLRLGGSGSLSEGRSEDAADSGEDDDRDGTGRGDRYTAVASLVYLRRFGRVANRIEDCRLPIADCEAFRRNPRRRAPTGDVLTICNPQSKIDN